MEYSSVFPLPPEPLSWFGFLRVEADLAFTFIQSAGLYSDPKDSNRALGNARKALAQIQRCLANPAKYNLTQAEVSSLEKFSVKIASVLDSVYRL